MKISDPDSLKLLGSWRVRSDKTLYREKKVVLIAIIRELEGMFLTVLKNNERQFRIISELSKDMPVSDYFALVEKFYDKTVDDPPEFEGKKEPNDEETD